MLKTIDLAKSARKNCQKKKVLLIPKLLLKFYEPTQGSILLGGKGLSEYSAHSLRGACGIVMQDNFIFSDTIKRNILMGEEYDETRMKRAIELSCLKEYVDRLPLGVETKVGRDGTGISGGEKQRLMIARAIYKQPQYMMLDEATSSLDAENERIITENMERLFHDRTMVVIAHRLSTVKNANQIIVLRHGEIAEQGTHDELLVKNGTYAKLVSLQSFEN